MEKHLGQKQAEQKESGAHMWGGRFTEATDAFVAEFTASIGFDQRLAQVDIQGSKAHAQMLVKVGVLTAEEGAQIQQGLSEVSEAIQAGRLSLSVALEDIHMNVEAALIANIGEVGKKLHTGRSRNDQVATDLRLYLRDAVDRILVQLTALQKGCVALAEAHADTVMPGFTHLQAAQPVTLGHHVLAWCEMFQRDRERLQACRSRINVMPLGAAALAGTTFPIDRAYVAELLAFEGMAQNSLDAVSDRDFAIEFCSVASMMMMHLSRIAEELVLWVSPQFDFIRLPDRYCTGSSIMPQKKNPDVPELVRGKTGRVVGHLMSLLMLMKSQPLAYNKDNQEDKEPLFDSVDTVFYSVMAFANMLPNIQVQKPALKAAAQAGFSTATDLADYLVRKSVPFRDAHEIVGSVVQLCVQRGCTLEDLPLPAMQAVSAHIQADVFEVLTLEGSVAARDHLGGTAPHQVRSQVQRWQRMFESPLYCGEHQ